MKVYKIKSGDTLSKIAKQYKLRTKTLQDFNKIADANKIKAGAVLKIPGVAEMKAYLKPTTRPIHSQKERLKLESLRTVAATKMKEKAKKEFKEYQEKYKSPKITGKEILEQTIKGLPATAKSIWKEELSNFKEITAKEIKIMVETAKGLPEATQVVFKALAIPVQKIMGGFEKWNKWYTGALKGILQKGLPSKDELEKTKNKIEELQKSSLPIDVKRNAIERIIREMKLQ